ncbi:MAG: hypothetical protein IJL87_02330, partial [Clostridia bacterium]|nr:hypothetical protein [Clostridia bacterium]
MSTFKKLSSITLAMLLIIMTFVFTAPVSSLAAEGDFSYEVTAVSGPVSGSINQSQIINVMYGIPLVLKITANRPFNLDYGIYGVGKVTCSIDDISPTEKQFTVKAKNISDYNYDSNPIYLYFKDENDDTITTFNFDAK